MKNKKVLYLLIPASVLIWGNIVYKIYTSMYGEDAGAIVFESPKIVNSIEEELNDTFSIDPNYRDPFLGKTLKNNSASENSTHPVVSTSESFTNKSNSKIQMPTIIYGGLIKNKKSNKQFALIQINGIGNVMKVSDKVGEITLMKIYRDSIQVKYNNQLKFISR